MAPFKLVEHTADIGIEVEAESIEQLFSDSAAGMFAVISGSPPDGWPESHTIELSAPDTETLLVDWLNELLYMFEVKKFFTTKAELDISDGNRLKATVSGTKFKGIFPGTEIKAVTYHMLSVDRTVDGYETRIYFDL
ncbi:MAG TPA: archease [bacterium]|nr:archease [bacterium]